MILPDEAEVKKLSDVEPGSLVLWSENQEKNVFAICFKSTEDAGNCMAVLNAENGKDCPYPCLLEHETVLDFGKKWLIDVETGKEVLDLEGMKRGPLIRKGANYFLRLAGGNSYTGSYVNLSTGEHFLRMPETETTGAARWNDFKIFIPQEHNRKPAQVLHWEKNK